uniref:Zinc finger piccolo-type domain-containing protein n=1 Tax=Denticeps clupeoides TaxID=299321 RepID=A0AAY4CF55_9TELE
MEGGFGGRGDPHRLATHESSRPAQLSPSPTSSSSMPSSVAGQSPGQHASRKNLQVDFSSTSRSGRSPSVSPDRSSAPTSPYSVPQIAPMPSSKLCPICNTTELTGNGGTPNFNKCTQCRTTVCNQCGFNPNPHLTEVQEWLCLNCQMQRALGMDMTTPRSKSQQQIHSPSHQPKKPEPQPQPHGMSQPGTRIPHPGAVPLPGLAKAPSQPDLGRGSPVHHIGGRMDQTRSAGSSPARRPQPTQEPPQDGLTKLFGFGASLLNQASTLISVDPLSGTTTPQPSPARSTSGGPRVLFSDANAGAATKGPSFPAGPSAKPAGAPFQPGLHAPLQKQQQQSPTHQQKAPQQESLIKQAQPVNQKPKPTCPLCKTELNVGSTDPHNYNSCTQCHTQVCNMCGFNPTPHLVEKKEWLCLNCQTQRLMSGGLGDTPLPVPQPSPKHQPMGSPRHQALSSQQPAQQPSFKKISNQQPQGPKAMPSQQKASPKPPKGLERERVSTKTEKEPEPLPSVTKETKTTPKKGPQEPVTSITPAKDEKREYQKSRYYEEISKTNSTHDLSRSPQSLSDTGYSSDGISSSHSEITGLIQEEEMMLSKRGLSGHHTPPSPSEITKLESTMRPLLESKVTTDKERNRERERGHSRHHSREADDKKQRPHSLSISPEAYDSDEELEDIMEEEEDPADWEAKRELRVMAAATKERKKADPPDMTDEEFMRRQIMEMSADEDNEDEEMEEDEEEDEGYGYEKLKKTHKHISDSGKEKRRLTHHSSSFEEETKVPSEISKGYAEEGEEDLMASQGGLRRFKTIELNNTSSYSRDIELSNENDLSLDREPELEMESLTGSPEERSRGEYSSTLPPTTSSYTSGTSPTSISSMEDDSDSSPSRRQRLEEAKQHRKARHRSHGPLLPTIEDSSEEDELREEEELLREQEKMREVEQQRIRSTARKTKRDKEELRAQRRRERSKTPPSNLSPIEDASPTEELRQAAEMEELHRSSCSEYSPSIDSEAEGFEMSSKLYKSGSEYNLPTFMSLYSPTDKPDTASSTTTTTTSSSGKPLKSAEEVYEEMMRKAEMLQKQQQHTRTGQQYNTSAYQEEDVRNGHQQQYEDEYEYVDEDITGYEDEEVGDIYEEIRQTSQTITKELDEQGDIDGVYPDKQLLDTGSAFAKLLEQSNALLTPGTSPTQLSAPVSFSETGRGIPDVRVTQHFSKDAQKHRLRSQTGKNGITPTAAATTIAAYGVYSRDAVTVSQTSVSQTVTSTQSTIYGRHTGGSITTTATASSVTSKTAEITQTYSQRESSGRRLAENRGVQVRDSSTASDTIIEARATKVYSYYKASSPPLSPAASPTHSPTRSTSKRTVEFSTQTFNMSVPAHSGSSLPTSPVMAQGTQTSQRAVSPRLFRQQSSQDSPFMVIGSEHTNPSKPVTVNTATSPLSSPTGFSHQSTFDEYSPPMSPPDTPPHQHPPQPSFYRTQRVEKVSVGTSMVTTATAYTRGSLSMDNISLCRISTVPGTSRVEQGQMLHGGSVADLRTATKPAPVIMTDQGMDLTSLATESRKYSGSIEGSPSRHSSIVQPLIMNLNAQEAVSTATTVSVTVAASMFISQHNQPAVYGDPLHNRIDLGVGMGPQQLQQHHQLQTQQAATFARFNLTSQLPLLKKDLLVSQTSCAPAIISAISPSNAPDMDSAGGPVEMKCKSASGAATPKPHAMMVQMDDASENVPVTQLVRPEESQDAMDFTGQIKPETQVACCDVVYRLPFGGSCVGGPFSKKTKSEEIPDVGEPAQPPSAPPQLYQPLEAGLESQPYQDLSMKSYTLPFPGRLHPSMSETNLADPGLQPFQAKLDPQFQASGELAMNLTTKQGYDGGFLGMGLQYGSYTDLRLQADVATPPLPIRRYSSLSNISSDYGYSSRDLASIQESNLAQYSATTAREISRMCAALNSMDRFGSNPDLVQYGIGRGGSTGRINLPQGLATFRPNLMYGPDGKIISHSQALTNLINARQASLRAMYPSAIRSADGMIYSTINTPIASTLPITTQPASVMRPLLRGVYRPYPTPNMTPVPLASLTRLPIVTPRMPLSGSSPYCFPAPSQFPVTTTSAPISESAPISTVQDAPLYLGKSTVCSTALGTPTHPPSYNQAQHQPPLAQAYPPAVTQSQPINLSATTTISSATGTPAPGKETEQDRLHQQQEQLLQLERERVELEKLRQLRLQEDLERERAELQRHREKEQMLVQREIQELQNIKQHVLQQQQAERESQLVMQREQLAQQKHQLDQIQSLQQQLQQQLEEQKRQKTAAAVAAVSTNAQGRVNHQQDLVPEMHYGDGHVTSRSLPNSASEMCLRSEELETRSMRKQKSMPRLQDGSEGEVTLFPLVRRIVDSSVQTDDEDGEERFLLSRRRRTRRSVDCSVQTDDDEDKADWEQPVRRRRSRYTRHSESGTDARTDSTTSTTSAGAKVASSSIAVQTIRDCSCQTEPDQLGRVSPSIHVTVSDPNKVEIVHYISGPERTQKGQSLACQTDPDAQSQSVVIPHISVATAVSPYSSNIQLVAATDPLSPRQQAAKFERRRPDPLEIGYQQHHLHNESLSSFIRQQPKSPQVLYSPVSPLSSPHRIIETSFSSNERLNKAHVTPQQKSYTAESPQRHQSLPRPIKNVQRSMSDPKPLSPTTDDHAKARLSLYQQQALQSQVGLSGSLLRKVKRTLPSPPPDETQLPLVTPALPQMYVPSVPSMKAGTRPGLISKANLLKDLTHELKAVEQESTKLRKQQAELEEEEKEIDAKLRYLELGITQRKETLVKERERREIAYLRCMGDTRDYMSDSELNNLRLAAAAVTAPLSQFSSELNTAAQYPSTSSFVSYQYPQSQPAPAPQATPFQTSGFNQPPYPTVSQAQALPQPTPLQTHHPPPSFSTQSFPQSQPPYPTEPVVLPQVQTGHPGFQPPPSASTYQPQVDILTVHQRPRQTSLADLEHKLPTNYEVISNPTVVVTTTAQDTTYSQSSMAPSYGQLHSVDSPSTYASDSLYGSSNLEQNVPRNYVMIDDINELTKEGMGTTTDPHRNEGHGRYGGDGVHTRGGSSYSRPEDEREEDLYDHHHSRGKSTGGYHPRGSDLHGRVVGSSSMGGGSSYYYDDYKYSMMTSRAAQRHSSKSLAPAVMSSKRSKHRKQGIEQKISKFSPIEEARDVEADLASYTMSTSTTSGYGSRSRKLQDNFGYGLHKSVYDAQGYYEEDDRFYSHGRSRSTGYGMDKITSRDTGYRSRSYERDYYDRSYRSSYNRGRPTLRSQYSEEESPLSPMGKLMGVGRGSLGADPSNAYGSSHSLPDVQDHIKDLPRTHVYKPDDMYIIDDMHCAVSDSEAYHLGQEETDWFEKPRDARSSRHYGSGSHSSGRRSHVKHTYHDYDEPPEEDLWPQEDYGHSRHSSSREHRHHGSGSTGRHSSSRHSDEPRSSRSSRSSKDPSMRHDSRGMSLSSVKRGDSRSQGYHSSDYSRDPTGHHHGPRSGKPSSHHQVSSSRKQQELQGHPSSSRQPGSAAPSQRSSGGPPGSSRQPGPSQSSDTQQGQRTQLQQQPQTSAARPGQPQPASGVAGQPQPSQAQQLQAKPGQAGPAARQPATGATPTPSVVSLSN